MNNKRFSWKNCYSPTLKFKLEREISWWQTHKLIILMITERTARPRLEAYRKQNKPTAWERREKHHSEWTCLFENGNGTMPSVLSPLAFKMALRTRRLAQMKVYFFPFVRRLMHRNAQNCYWMLIKIKKSLGNLIEHAIFRLSTQINAYFLLMNNKRFSWKNCDSPSSKFKLEREISWWQTHKLIILMITERTARPRLEIYPETGWGVMTCYSYHTEILNP